MGKGKTAVQASHASVSACEVARAKEKSWFKKWWSTGQTKIAVKVSSLEELKDLEQRIQKLNLPYAIINDAGRTQLPPGTTTAIAIGPAPTEKLTPLTGNLKLL